ncbi:MAG TPA: winged helix-turn-helix domain-containing protein [Silvibacterium sp.]|nr:winged helix-turn-helix domain-containing protein [Silvibacterium sp.]
MERPARTTLRIGAWRVDPASGEISRNGETARLEARTMRLLLCLAEHPGEVVSIDELLDQVWTGVAVSPDSVYQAVASLRRQLGDDPKQPSYIATVPRQGYRMVAAVSPREEPSSRSNNGQASEVVGHPQKPRTQRKFVLALAAGVAVCLALAGGLFVRGRIGHSAAAADVPQSQKSIAVLPFLDLTEGMKEEEFADGMTEELIDKLSKVPGLRVPSATSSFYFKGKQVPVADIAKSLGVAYVLDGSVRKSGQRVRIAARLVRAENGYVIWSETYDRPLDDLLMVQDDIAGEVAGELKESIGASGAGQ